MSQSGISVTEPIIAGVAAVTLVEAAAKDLEDLNDEILTAGHWPSWSAPELPDGLALCVRCWRVIMAPQLGVDRCRSVRRRAARR
jgi:hypothetical protein